MVDEAAAGEDEDFGVDAAAAAEEEEDMERDIPRLRRDRAVVYQIRFEFETTEKWNFSE